MFINKRKLMYCPSWYTIMIIDYFSHNINFMILDLYCHITYANDTQGLLIIFIRN